MGGVDLTENDLCLVTIGSLTENSDDGDQHTPAVIKDGPAPAWDLWRKIAKKSDDFGHPEVFSSDISKTKWESATVTTLDERIPAYIEKITQRSPFTGKVVTGGIKCVPVMMPSVTSFFMPRQAGDRPQVVPEGSVNFAFSASSPRRRATASSRPSTRCEPPWRRRTRCSTSTSAT
nr:oleate hydratase [Microbacterium lacticum]